MRAMGLGVVIKAGKGSKLKEGDNVHGPCGELIHFMYSEGKRTQRDFRLDGICCHEGQGLTENCVS